MTNPEIKQWQTILDMMRGYRTRRISDFLAERKRVQALFQALLQAQLFPIYERPYQEGTSFQRDIPVLAGDSQRDAVCRLGVDVIPFFLRKGQTKLTLQPARF